MAQLKDTVVAGSLRATDTLYATTGQFKIIKVATSNSNAAYSAGTAGQFLHSGGTSSAAYWGSLASGDIPTISITEKTSGTLPVSRGGTGATSFTANSVIISGGGTTSALTTRAIYNKTAKGNLEWTSSSTDTHIITKNTLAYWDGSYNTSNNSNLTYCVKGAFGNASTYAVDDATSNGALGTGTALTTERSVYYGLVTVNNADQTRATGIYAPTSGGTANTQALVSNGTSAPKWVNIGATITIGAGTSSAAPTVNVTVLGQSGTAQSITTASTSVYGVTKLSAATNDASLAATAKSVYDLAQTVGGLSNAMHFIGIATVAYTASNFPNISGYSTPAAGDVVIDKDKKYEYVYVDSTNKWELLGGDESYALSSAVINKSIITAKGDIIYGNASSDPTILAGNTTTTVKFLSMTSSTPSWVTLQASDIPSITKSKISDFSHTHGNITNDGKIGSTANYAVYTTTGGTVTASSFTVNSPTASGTATSFIATVSQDSKGQITATKASLPTASTTTAGITTVGASGGAAAYSHGTHVSYGTSAAAVSTSASAGSAATVSRSDHVHNISLATGDSNGQIKIAGQNVGVKGLESGAFTTAYVHPTSAGNIHLPSGGTTGNFLKYGGSSGTGIWKNILTNDVKPIETKTYTDIIATANDQNGAGFFYAKVRGTTYDTVWHVKVRVTASVPSNVNFYATSIYDLWGTANTYLSYRCQNAIKNTSYRPLYYNTLFRVNSTGYTNNMGSWIGFSLFYANSPTDTNLKRTVVIDLLEYDNCTVEMQDSLITPTNIPNRTTSGYYNSTNTGYDNFDFCNNGLRETGDDNSTSISWLYEQWGGFTADNLLGRYQIIFQELPPNDNKLISIYNIDNKYDVTNKTLLASVFDPNGIIYYHNANGTTAAAANIDPGRLYSAGLFDLRYTFNVTSTASSTTFTGTRYKPLYLRVNINASTGGATVDGNQPLTMTLPSSNDGKYYIYLGQLHDWYRVVVNNGRHPVFYHNGTEIVRYYGKLIGGTAVAANTVPLSGVSSADDLKAIEALSGNSGFLKKTAANTWTLDTSTYLTSHQTYTAFTGKPTGNQTPGFGSTFTIQQISQLTTGQVSGTDRTVTIPETIATNTVKGLVKPWYSHTAASTGPTTGTNATAVAVNAISTTSGKYYAVEADSNGRLFVNVPWTNVNNNYLTGITTTVTGSGNAITAVEVSGSTITFTKGATYNNYSHPTTTGNKHIPSGGSSGQFLGWSADGTAAWVANPNTNTTYSLSGALSSHKFSSTLTPSSGSATTADITFAAGTNISLTDDTSNRKITIANTYSLPTAAYNTLGGVKPAYSSTNAATLTTTAATNTTTPTIEAKSTTSNRYYGIEADKNGILFVNVPWTNVNNSYLTGITSTSSGSGNVVTGISTSGNKITYTLGSMSTSGHTHNYAGSSSAGGAATNAATTADTTNALYPIGVTSAATTTLKRDTAITFTGGTIKASKYQGSVIELEQGTAVNPSLSSNARIQFGYNNNQEQPVSISYTPNDSYRSPAGLKIMGGTSATPAWLEVEGNIYAAGFNGPLTGNVTGNVSGSAGSATKATQDESGNNIKATYAASFSISDHTITLKNKNGASLGTVTVPDNNTLNTAGSTSSASKLFLIGAASQAANPQTYSHSRVFETAGAFSAKTLGINADSDANKATLQWNSTLSAVEFVFA